MKFFVCILALVALAQADIDFSKYKPRDIYAPVKGLPSFGERIVGGNEAAPHQFPYQAALLIDTNQGSFFCGGSLISPNYVLTAAHCVDGAQRTQVILGAHRFQQSEPGQVRLTSYETKVHEKWNSAQISDDIAYVKLPQAVQTNANIQIITLPSRSDIGNSFAGETGTISGWGKDSDSAGGVSSVLRFVQTPIITNDVCANDFGPYVRDTNICADGKAHKGSCSGDSGGPMVADGKQVGIVSYGSGYGCEKGYSSVFTRLTSYLDWIQANTDADIDFSKYKPRDIYAPVKGIPSFGERIVGGQEATPHQFPYQVALLIDTDQGLFFCGGSLISNNYVLTAAHCVDGATETKVILGAHKFRENEPSQVRLTSYETKVHENWNSNQISDDIAYVKLPRSVEINENIQIVTLLSRSDVSNSFAGETGTISGWGKDSDSTGGVSPVLRFVETSIMTNNECKNDFGSYVRDTNICADGKAHKGSCSGDSGGPMVADGKQVGIVSYGSAYGCEVGYSSVFTRTTSYLDWIAENTDVQIN